MKEIKKYAEEVAEKVKDYLPEEYKDAQVNVTEIRKGRTYGMEIQQASMWQLIIFSRIFFS